MLRLADIEPDPTQPRIDLGDVNDLVASIHDHGLIQPLVVSPIDGVRYRIIAGARRHAACNRLGLQIVPAIVRTERDQERLEIQLIENLHRKNLHPFEEADGYHRLANEFNLTHERLAQRMGKSRTHITQTLSLAKIPGAIRRECQGSDNPLSRDTLYLIAKQPTEERMREVMRQALLPAEERPNYEELREGARKGPSRSETGPRKPKAKFTTRQQAVVIVQSLTGSLTPDRIMAALEEAAEQARREAERG